MDVDRTYYAPAPQPPPGGYNLPDRPPGGPLSYFSFGIANFDASTTYPVTVVIYKSAMLIKATIAAIGIVGLVLIF